MLPTTSRTSKATCKKKNWKRNALNLAWKYNRKKTLQESMNERLKTCARRLLFMVTIIYWDIVRTAIRVECMQFLAPWASILDVLFHRFFRNIFFLLSLSSCQMCAERLFGLSVYLHDNLHLGHFIRFILFTSLSRFSRFYLDTSTSFETCASIA